jgi:hypothetical protein
VNGASTVEHHIRRPLFRFPFRFIVGAALVCAGTFVFVEMMARAGLHRWITLKDYRVIEPYLRDPTAICWTFIGILYASFRTMRYYPALSYGAWLSSTPWQSKRPLPLGPPHLVWEDMVPALLVALWCGRPVLPMTAFAVIYGLMAVRVSWRGRDGKWVLALFVCLAAYEVLIWPSDRLILVIDLAILVAADVAVRRSLFDLPWVRPIALEARVARANLGKSKWPLAPLTPMNPMAAADGWTIAAVAGWVVNCVAGRVIREDPGDADSAAIVVGLVLSLAALLRWGNYCGMYHPPISIWGRIRTLRLVVPGYDHVLIAPLAAAAIGIAIPFSCWTAGWKYPVVLAATTLLVMCIILNAGPTISQWQLTGHHRIVLQRRRNGRRPAGSPGSV